MVVIYTRVGNKNQLVDRKEKQDKLIVPMNWNKSNIFKECENGTTRSKKF